jgi:hypothetical protein
MLKSLYRLGLTVASAQSPTRRASGIWPAFPPYVAAPLVCSGQSLSTRAHGATVARRKSKNRSTLGSWYTVRRDQGLERDCFEHTGSCVGWTSSAGSKMASRPLVMGDSGSSPRACAQARATGCRAGSSPAEQRKPTEHTNRHRRPGRFRVSRVERLSSQVPVLGVFRAWAPDNQRVSGVGAERAITRHREARMMPGIDGHRRVERCPEHRSAGNGGPSQRAGSTTRNVLSGSERVGVATQLTKLQGQRIVGNSRPTTPTVRCENASRVQSRVLVMRSEIRQLLLL